MRRPAACASRARRTGRERLIICGYHGWHDWYVGTTVRNKGVPAIEASLSDRVPYNDLDAVHALFKKYPGQVAALILEPMNVDRAKARLSAGAESARVTRTARS